MAPSVVSPRRPSGGYLGSCQASPLGAPSTPAPAPSPNQTQVLAPRRAEPPPHDTSTYLLSAVQESRALGWAMHVRGGGGEGRQRCDTKSLSSFLRSFLHLRRCTAAGRAKMQVNNPPRTILPGWKGQAMQRASRTRTVAFVSGPEKEANPTQPGQHRNLCVRLQGPRRTS